MGNATVHAAKGDQAAALPSKAPPWFGPAFALPPAIAALLFALLLPSVSADTAHEWTLAWAPELGVELAFRVDGLSLLFALLVTGIGAATMLYAGVYMKEHPRIGRFFLYLTLFMISMLGLVLADDAIALFVFWELTTITSFLLIGFTHDDPTSRRNALQALLVTGGGGLVLLAGLLLLGMEAGTLRLSRMDGAAVQASALGTAMAVLVIIGCFTKSAQVPFHFWLPNAMSAPTPVSAYLHSATMVKAGVYLMARFAPVFGDMAVWVWSLTVAGALTAVIGALWALRQTDLKQMLAWTTVMALGTLTLLLAGSESVSIAAAMTFLVVHALYKATLFLVVGILDHDAGTRDRRQLSGLLKAMPLTAAAAMLAAGSMAGFPPFLGFIGKELTYEGALALTALPWLSAVGLVLASACMVAVAGMIALGPFLGRERRSVAEHPHDPPVGMLLGPILLAAMGLAFGLAPALISGSIVQPAVVAVMGGPAEVKLVLWHGINVPLMLGLLTFAIGIGLYVFRDRAIAAVDAVVTRLPTTGDAVYDRGLTGLKWLAAAQTAVLQCGRPRVYLAATVAVVAVAVLATLVVGGGLRWPAGNPTPDLLGVAAVVVAAAGTVLVVLTPSRLAAIGGLGMVGTAIAVLFLMHGAVDVATTQFLVETLVVVLLAVAMLRLPPLTRLPPRRRGTAVRDGLIAGAAGLMVTCVLLAVLAEPFDRRVTDFFEAASWPEAYGRNIVNVILVDFRALDTFGEIAVVAVAGLGAYALLRNDRVVPKAPADSLILRTALRGLAALLLVFALFMLLRGHNEPGGGFIAGLIAATAFALVTLGHGVDKARRAVGAAPRAVALGGLGLALAAGMAGLFSGGAPFEGLWMFLGGDPATGDKGTPLSTVLLFDIGVFLVVVGSVLAIVFALEEEA